MKYEDFVINIESKKGDDAYVINVQSPRGEADATFQLRHGIDDMLEMFQRVGQTVRGSATEEGGLVRDAKFVEVKPNANIDVGKELFEDLFVGTTRSLFDSSLAVAEDRGKGLRIKLQIDPTDPELAKLASLPWESMVRQETKDYYSLQEQTPFVRYLNVQRPHEVSKFVPPLRVLVVISNPKGTAPLDLDHERSLMEQSLGAYPEIQVDFLESATVSELNQKLSEKKYHVLHYMGHGDFDEKSGMGVLLMEDAAARAAPLDGERLGVILRSSSIRLVFLNACNTAKADSSSGKDAFGGVATSLVAAGMPAVVAMQFPISDKAAIAFSRKFYSQIVRGRPVDAAVATSRLEVFSEDASNLEWATPVLFMRAPDGMLFDLEKEKPADPTPSPEPVQVVIEPDPAPPKNAWLKWAGAIAAGVVLAVAGVMMFSGNAELDRMQLMLPESVDMAEDVSAELSLYDVNKLVIVGSGLQELVSDVTVTVSDEAKASVTVGDVADGADAIPITITGIRPGEVDIVASVPGDTSVKVEKEEIEVLLTDTARLEAQLAKRELDDAWRDSSLSDQALSERIALFQNDHGFALEGEAAAEMNQRADYLSSAMTDFASASALGNDLTKPILAREVAWLDYLDKYQTGRSDSPAVAAAKEGQEAIANIKASAPWVNRITTCQTMVSGRCQGDQSVLPAGRVNFHVSWMTPARGALTFQLSSEGEVLKTAATDTEPARSAARNWFGYFTVSDPGVYEILARNQNGDLVWRQSIEVQ